MFDQLLALIAQPTGDRQVRHARWPERRYSEYSEYPTVLKRQRRTAGAAAGAHRHPGANGGPCGLNDTVRCARSSPRLGWLLPPAVTVLCSRCISLARCLERSCSHPLAGSRLRFAHSRSAVGMRKKMPAYAYVRALAGSSDCLRSFPSYSRHCRIESQQHCTHSLKSAQTCTRARTERTRPCARTHTQTHLHAWLLPWLNVGSAQ